MMATAGKITVAEVEELVEVGQLDPDGIHTPGIYVRRIFQAPRYEKPIEQRTTKKALMRWVAVDTVGDEGAAQVAREALVACEIPVELKRVGANPYLGARVEIEVRVPDERLADAEEVLAQLEIDAEAAASAASLAPPEPEPAELEDEPSLQTAPPPRRLSWGVFAVAGAIACALWLLLKLFP